MSHSNELLKALLDRLAKQHTCTTVEAAALLTQHDWKEIEEREAFYLELNKALTHSRINIGGLQDCIQKHGSTILGGHAVFRSRVKGFLEWDGAESALSTLLQSGNAIPTIESIDHFVQLVIEHGFHSPEGNPSGGDAAYFTSVLLTAVFPDHFLGCRLTRWDWMARQFDLPPDSDMESYGKRIAVASAGARELAASSAFEEYFPSEHPLWTLGGLTFLLNREKELRQLVEEIALTADHDASLKTVYRRFKADRQAQFAVRLRHHRAAQLRKLLADPQAIDLETFNREVWVVWHSAFLDGKDVSSQLAHDASLSSEQLETLEQGLESGTLEVHGNCMWGSGTRIYGPMLTGGDEVRLKNVQRALTILNDDQMSPLAKAKDIETIPGFGQNIATGLAMTFHPDSFGIWNGPSSDAILKLGYQAADLDNFEQVISDVREVLGAEDFIELDYFFFLINQGYYEFEAKQPGWWICQGTMYDSEKAKGYLFAPMETANGRSVQHHDNLALMKPGQKILHYSGKAIRAVGTVRASAKEQTRPDTMPGEESGRLGYYVSVLYRDLKNPIKLDDIPDEWRTKGEQPFTRKGKVKQGYAFPVSQAFLKNLEQRFPELADPKELPPSSDRRIVKIAPGGGAKFWEECLSEGFICVGWGDVGNLLDFSSKEQFQERFEEVYRDVYNNHGPTISRKGNELWKLTELKPGDLVVANQGVSHVLAIGEVVEPTYEYLPSPSRDDHSHVIHVKWDTSVAKDIPKQGFWGTTTIADVPADLYEFIISKETIPTASTADYVEPSFADIKTRIQSKGLRISDRTLRRYHLSLKTRGFVILCGLSGSGKTWLAELYAEAIDAERELVPVAPNWTTNEDLIGYLNPMDGQYHDTGFSRFLRRASEHYEEAVAAGKIARPFHLILDEMNLARVEYYFAKFLSAMEQRSRTNDGKIELGGSTHVLLPPNLHFVGTVNVDETTHGFADKVYDRAQLIEITVDRDLLAEHLGKTPYTESLLSVWDAIGEVTPFAFRVLDEIKTYVDEATKLDVPWQEAVDEQLLQKVLTKIKGAEQRVENALQAFIEIATDKFPLSQAKANAMLEVLRHHGITSYF